MARHNNVVDKNSREYQLRQVGGARNSLLLLIVMTLINVVMLLVGVDEYLYGDGVQYFFFSASVPYNLVLFGVSWDLGIDTFTITSLVIGGVILAVYLLCWLLSKKKGGWLVAALVLFIVDTLALLLLSLSLDTLSDDIMDIVIHVLVIVQLVQGVAAGKKLKQLDAQVPAGYQSDTQPVQTTQDPWDRKDGGNGPEF